MTVDPDDEVAFMLPYAMRDLLTIAARHSDPNEVLREWFIAVASVLIAGQWPGRSLESLMLVCARRVTQDAAALL